MPTYLQMQALFTNLPTALDEKSTENQRLKDGHRNALFAIVDCGIISFVRLGDVSFGDEEIYKRTPRNKRQGQKKQ